MGSKNPNLRLFVVEAESLTILCESHPRLLTQLFDVTTGIQTAVLYIVNLCNERLAKGKTTINIPVMKPDDEYWEEKEEEKEVEKEKDKEQLIIFWQ